MAKKHKLFSIQSIQLAVMESQPPQLAVTVMGLAASSGWSEIELVPLEKTLSPDGILDLDFVGTPPDGMSLPMLTPAVANLVWKDDVERLIGVKVYSRTEDVVQLLPRAPENFRGAFTTMMVGEEDRPTPRVGETDPVPTRRLGETHIPTTLPRAEEDPPTGWVGEDWPTRLWPGEDLPTRWPGENPPTDPRIDDPVGPIGERWLDPDDIHPFGRRRR